MILSDYLSTIFCQIKIILALTAHNWQSLDIFVTEKSFRWPKTWKFIAWIFYI